MAWDQAELNFFDLSLYIYYNQILSKPQIPLRPIYRNYSMFRKKDCKKTYPNIDKISEQEDYE